MASAAAPAGMCRLHPRAAPRLHYLTLRANPCLFLGKARVNRRRDIRMRKWLLRISVGVVALVLAMVVVVQVALWTNLPRRIVLGQLQRQLGLRVSAASLSTGWLGNTSLRDVRLSLPLAEESFLSVPEMQVTHTSLPMLLLRRGVTVEAIRLEQPTLIVRRDETGRWNFSEVAELIARTGGKENRTTSTAPPRLPKVTVDDATLVVKDTGGRTATVRPIDVKGTPDGPLAWRYDVQVPEQLSVTGQIAPGGAWKHEVDLTLTNVAELARPWGPVPANAMVKASWQGRLNAGRVAGRLGIFDLHYGTVGARGVVDVRDNGGGSVLLEPQMLTVTTEQAALPEVQLASGRITADSKTLRADRLLLAGIGGNAQLDGAYTFNTRSGELAAAWTDLMIPKAGITGFGGSVKLKLATPFPDRPQVEGSVVTRGVTPDGPWESTVGVVGNGRGGWDQMDWTLTAQDLEWKGNYPFTLDGLVAKLETRPSEKSGAALVRLIDVDQPKHPAEARGEVDLGTGAWNAWVNVGGIGLPKSPEGVQLTFMLNAWGNPEMVRLNELFLRAGEGELWASGWYLYDRPRPVDLDVYIKHVPPRPAAPAAAAVAVASAGDAAGAAAAAAATPPAVDHPPVFGLLRGELHLTGTAAAPRDLDVTGKLSAQDLSIRKRAIGYVDTKITGRIDNKTARIKTSELTLLGAQWDLDIAYHAQNRAVDVELAVTDLPLKEVGDVFERNDVSGLADGKWTMHIPRPSLGEITASGELKARAVKVGRFDADRLEAKTVLEKGRVTVGPIRAWRTVERLNETGDTTTVSGTADASLGFAVATPRQMTASITLQTWPAQIGNEAWFDITGAVPELSIDGAAPPPEKRDPALPTFGLPTTLTANGNLDFTADFTWRGRAMGKASLLATLLGRELDLRRFRVDSLGGNLEAQAMVSADYPLQSTARVNWGGLDGRIVGDLFPAALGLEGNFSGSLRVAPATDRRALEPLAIELTVDPVGGRYIATELGPIRINAFTNLRRFVLSDPGVNPSTIHVAGGVVELWGRLSTHDLQTATRDVVSTQMTVRLRDISLDQLVHTGAPEADAMPGRLHGDFSIVGHTRGGTAIDLESKDPTLAFLERFSKSINAQGTVRITESNLGNVDVFAALYNLMNIGAGGFREPTGSGTAELRVEDGRMIVENLRYFNRGTEIRAVAQIDRVWLLPNSPITGTAVGTARPLRDVRLPFFADLDQVLSAVQRNLTTVAIDGTVRDPVPRPITFDDAGSDLRAIILGDVKASRD